MTFPQYLPTNDLSPWFSNCGKPNNIATQVPCSALQETCSHKYICKVYLAIFKAINLIYCDEV